MSIIYCPSCKSETLLTKDNHCETSWRCDRCNKCCLEKEGVPFQGLEKRQEQRKEETTVIKQEEQDVVVEKEKKRKKQLSIFDFLQ